MKVTEIVVRAGRTFNHPHEQYSNLRPEVELRALMFEGEDPQACAKELQAQAEGLVEDHKQGMLKSLEELFRLSERQAEVQGLERELRRTQERLDQIRKDHPQLQLSNGDADQAEAKKSDDAVF